MHAYWVLTVERTKPMHSKIILVSVWLRWLRCFRSGRVKSKVLLNFIV